MEYLGANPVALNSFHAHTTVSIVSKHRLMDPRQDSHMLYSDNVQEPVAGGACSPTAARLRAPEYREQG
jgi:hypothetical protein